MAAPRWRGSRDIEQGKIDVEETAGKKVVTMELNGPYERCLARRPKVGQSMAGQGSDLKVITVKVTELDGGAGRINVTLEATTDESTNSTEPIGEPQYEIQWTRMEKPIELHPRCGRLYEGRAKYKDGQINETEGKQRTWDDWESLSDVAPEGYGNGDYVEESDDSDTWSLDDYKSLRERGQESYQVSYPVVRRTSSHLAKPGDVGAMIGRISEPPTAANFTRVNDFEWLMTGDSCTKGRRSYTRTSEWTGAKKWSRLTYEE